jgi:hypothetical protein
MVCFYFTPFHPDANFSQRSQEVGNVGADKCHIDANINVIDIAFLNGITPPMTNFANAGDRCTPFSDNPWLLSCPEIE